MESRTPSEDDQRPLAVTEQLVSVENHAVLASMASSSPAVPQPPSHPLMMPPMEPVLSHTNYPTSSSVTPKDYPQQEQTSSLQEQTPATGAPKNLVLKFVNPKSTTTPSPATAPSNLGEDVEMPDQVDEKNIDDSNDNGEESDAAVSDGNGLIEPETDQSKQPFTPSLLSPSKTTPSSSAGASSSNEFIQQQRRATPPLPPPPLHPPLHPPAVELSPNNNTSNAVKGSSANLNNQGRPHSPALNPPTNPPMHAANAAAGIIAGQPSSTSLSGASGNTTASSSGMQLTDAFAYLDRVRMEFSEQPEVYNKFLQVMREFKANAIDANGVISRVVHLFKGHRSLILGFNAFLPRTHHIDPNLTDFTHLMQPQHASMLGLGQGPSQAQPHGSTVNALPGHHALSRPQLPGGVPPPASNNWPLPPTSQQQPSMANRSLPGQPVSIPSRPQLQAIHGPSIHAAASAMTHISNPAPIAPTAGTAFLNAHMHQPSHLMQHYNNAGSALRPPPASMQFPAVPPPTMQQTNSNASGGGGAPASFSRAVTYVKKIKQRFAADPDTYRAFLACLHAFHRDQRSVGEVCRQVSVLFKDAPDLMDEFMLFLPSAAGSNSTSMMDPVPSASSFSRKRSRNNQPSASNNPLAFLPASSSTAHLMASSHQMPSVARTAGERQFFEKVRAHLGSRDAYAEFLKCLALYSQDILRQRDLVHLASKFLEGAPALLQWFLWYIGRTGSSSDPVGSDRMDGAPHQADKTIPDSQQPGNQGNGDIPLLNRLPKIGSYRILPPTFVLPPATKRTPLGLAVLNDTAVCTASFEREDAGFVSSRKNAYEEAMFRCEDERFELDMLIEANAATIAVLEPLCRKLSSAQQQPDGNDEILLSRYRLDASLNLISYDENNSSNPNPSSSGSVIYKRAIRRVYGGERGDDFYRALLERPAIAAPVILRRLLAKDAEWRGVARQWNEVWREVHSRNALRALDHQGIDFRAHDRKALSLKTFLHELESSPSPSSCGIGTASAAPDCKARKGMGMVSLVPPVPLNVVRLLKLPPSAPNNPLGDQLIITEVANDVKRILQPHVQSPEKDLLEWLIPALFSTSGRLNVVLLYANCTLYGLVRMLRVAVERLTRMHHLSNPPADGNGKYGKLIDLLLLSNFHTNAPLSEPQQPQSQASNSLQFEDAVRGLYGSLGYPMYTWDRLTMAIARQCSAALSDPSTSSLLDLFQHNQHRVSANLPEKQHLQVSNPFTEYVSPGECAYRLAAEAFLPSHHLNNNSNYSGGNEARDSYLIRVVITTNNCNNSNSVEEGEHWGFGLVERIGHKRTGNLNQSAERGSSVSGRSLHRDDKNFVVFPADPKWAAYLDAFCSSNLLDDPNGDEDVVGSGDGRPFLRRLLRKLKALRGRSYLPDNNSNDSKNRWLLVNYGLLCKIALNSYRLLFVKGTEDVLLYNALKRLYSQRNDNKHFTSAAKTDETPTAPIDQDINN